MNIYPRVMTVKSAEMLAKEMTLIGVSPEGIDLMAGKGVFRTIKIENVPLKATLLIKQEMLAKGGATGRKLDFLIQEFNREANTIGSKCSDIEVTRHVVDMKAEIEKIREQVQNVE